MCPRSFWAKPGRHKPHGSHLVPPYPGCLSPRQASGSEVFSLLRLHVNKTQEGLWKWGFTCLRMLTAGREGEGIFLGIAGQEGSELLGVSQTPPDQDRAQLTTGTSLKKLPKQDFPQQAGVPHK